jgi:hypothetical protein
VALNVYELARSRPLSRDVEAATLTLKFLAMYSSSETDVYGAVLAAAPTALDGYPRVGQRCEPMGAGVWACEVSYAFSQLSLDATPRAAPGEGDPLGPEYSGIDITAGQVHVTQSLKTSRRWQAADQVATGVNLTVDAANSLMVTPDGWTVSGADTLKKVLVASLPGWTPGVYAVGAITGGQWTLDASPAAVGTTGGRWMLTTDPNATGTAVDYKQAIGVTTDAVAGCDIFAPHEEFGLVSQVGPFTLAHKRLIRSLAATVNNAPWRGFAGGELLYLGCTARCGPGNVWVLNHKFAAGENLYCVPITPDLMLPAKLAWEWLWTPYPSTAPAGTPDILRVPTRAYTEQVYRFSDFTASFALLNLAG